MRHNGCGHVLCMALYRVSEVFPNGKLFPTQNFDLTKTYGHGLNGDLQRRGEDNTHYKEL